MFIKQTKAGYTEDGEQFANGRFLVVFSHNPYKAEEQANRPVYSPVDWMERRRNQSLCSCAGNPSYFQKSCPTHKDSYVIPTVDCRKLYATVRQCNMKQFGNWMMGTVNIAGQRVTVSGSYGSDGLPTDYENLNESALSKVVPLPDSLANEFWAGGGHNSSGKEATAMRQWALATFK